MNKRIVIFVFTHKPVNHSTGEWGLGDLLKGLIHVYQLSKKHNFELYVDMQYHTLSNYFKTIEHQYKDNVKDNIHNIYLFNNDVEEYILNNYNNYPILYLMCNKLYKENITDDCREYIKNILIPNDKLQLYITNKINKIPYEKYEIIHYRIGDYEMTTGKENTNISKNYHNFMLNIHLTKKENTILISDSKSFKKYVKKFTHIFAFDDEPTHIGTYNNNLYDSLADFFIIIGSSSIKSYSIYEWESGFIKIPSDIYNIPVKFYKI
jgi:hypothetical protein